MKSRRRLVKIPNDMPLVLGIMDDLTTRGPVSSTYFALWCNKTRDDTVVVDNPREMAFLSGLVGQRGEQTWRGRLRMLSELQFINFKEDLSAQKIHVLILDPYLAIKGLFKRGVLGLRVDKYAALFPEPPNRARHR
jgi:hypothetical protein